MALSEAQRAKLWTAFLSVYDPNIGYIELKKAYAKKVVELNIPWCTPCQTSSTFQEFRFEAEDLSSEEIQTILNSNQTTMPVKKTAKKADTKKATKAVVKKKTTTKKTEKKIIAPKVVEKKVVDKKVEPTTLPGGIKFLYIPKRK